MSGTGRIVCQFSCGAASAAEVWRRKRFIVNRSGAPCSKALKRNVLNAYHQAGDTIVLGYTADPRDAARLDRYIDSHAEDLVWSPTAGRFIDEPAVECGATCEMPDDAASRFADEEAP
jgi:hypothetical protein